MKMAVISSLASYACTRAVHYRQKICATELSKSQRLNRFWSVSLSFVHWIFLLLLCSCSPNSSEEFRQEGEGRCRLLVATLQKIENREQLLLAEPALKKHFERLIDLMIDAREFQEGFGDVPNENAFGESARTTSLELELRRIYTIEGGREVIERAQQEPLVRLDAYERALAKKREFRKMRS